MPKAVNGSEREVRPEENGGVLPDLALDSKAQSQETLALLKILALGRKQETEGKLVAFDEVVTRIRARETVG